MYIYDVVESRPAQTVQLLDRFVFMIFSKYIFWKYIVTHNIPSQEAIFFLPDDKAIAQNRQLGNFFKGGQKKLSIYDNRFFIIQSVHEDYHSIIFFIHFSKWYAFVKDIKVYYTSYSLLGENVLVSHIGLVEMTHQLFTAIPRLTWFLWQEKKSC